MSSQSPSVEVLDEIEASLWGLYGATLLAARKAAGVSRKAVARRLGCTDAMLKTIEEGRRLKATAASRRLAVRLESLAASGFNVTEAERVAEIVRQVLREEPPSEHEYALIYARRTGTGQ